MATTYTRTAGWIFMILALIGLFTRQLLGSVQFDQVHSWIHLILGVLAFAAVANSKEKLFAVLMGPALVLLGASGFFLPGLTGIQIKAEENFLILLLGGWGIYASVYKRT